MTFIDRIASRIQLGGTQYLHAGDDVAPELVVVAAPTIIKRKGPAGMNVIEGRYGLYSPQVDRRSLNQSSDKIAEALRAGDLDEAGRILASGPADLGLSNAVLGRDNLYKVPWLVPDVAGPVRKDIMLLGADGGFGEHHLVAEIALRGAKADPVYSWKSLRFSDDGSLFVGDKPRSFPDAVMPVSSAGQPDEMRRVLDRLEAAGVFVVNRGSAQLAGRDKNVMAEIWNQTDVSIPRSLPNLRTIDDVLAAGEQLGYPAVLKNPRSAVSRGVWGVKDRDEAVTIAGNFGLKQDEAVKAQGLLMQEMLDMSATDIRFHGARDAVTGEMRIMGATERVALGKDFRANGGVEGNMIRPIYKLDGSDPALPQELIDEGLRAGQAAGLDWFSADIGRLKSGKPIIIEVDNMSHPLEMNHPVPREQQIFPRAAELLVNGDREIIAAQRALHDVPNLRDQLPAVMAAAG